MPNQPPHPPYSDTYVLPKTKYGIPVTPEMFENNNFTTDREDHKSHWWEAVWAEEAAKQRRLREEREERGEFPDIERSQRYHATTAEELEAYRSWQKEAEENEREKARDKRFRRAAREAEEMMKEKVAGEKITVRMQADIREVEERKEIVPWEWQESQGQGEDSGYGGQGGNSQEGNKLKKWFKKVLP